MIMIISKRSAATLMNQIISISKGRVPKKITVKSMVFYQTNL